MSFRLSLIVTTVGRPTLASTLKSLVGQGWEDGDEILLVGDGPVPVAECLWRQFGLPGRYVEVPKTVVPDWGHTPRNLTMPMAVGDYLMALDDDDTMAVGAVAAVRKSLREAPSVPHLFRMDGCPRVGTVWKEKVVRHANVGTPTLVAPNDPQRLGRYTSRYGGDFDFIKGTTDYYDRIVWDEEIICHVRPHERPQQA